MVNHEWYLMKIGYEVISHARRSEDVGGYIGYDGIRGCLPGLAIAAWGDRLTG